MKAQDYLYYKKGAVDIHSILKQILKSKDCSYGKYMARMEYVSSTDDETRYFYMTPAATKSGKMIIIITCIINENWNEIIQQVGEIIGHLHKNYNFSPSDYTHVLHGYFESVELEQFYVINTENSDFTLNKLSIGHLDRLLS
jgi:hypothetical protein